MATKPPATSEPIPDDAPAAAEHTGAPLQPNPAAGGRYTFDPATGALTLVTPSTVQE